MKKILSSITIFWGAFLLFGVQPMVGNTLLPVFGGTAAVWTVCLASFQILLLVGYFYAHAMARSHTTAETVAPYAVALPRRRPSRVVWHLGLVFAGAAWAGVVAFDRSLVLGWAGEGTFPALQSLLAVVLLVGLPYTLLSSNSSLVQAWSVEGGDGDRGVYKLYAVSNAGSFCGLLAYPLLVEPYLPLGMQWAAFAVGLAVYGLLLAGLAWCVAGSARSGERAGSEENAVATSCDPPATTAETNRQAESQPNRQTIEWLALSALSCFLLNGVSAHLCNDVTPLPLLWAAMLALYLLSWVFGFTDRGAKTSVVAAIVAIALAVFGAWHVTQNAGTGFFVELGVGLALIFFGGWTIHARLYSLRPSSRLLTRYYLFIALGGALGGTVASLAIPALFDTVVEYPVALALLLVPAMLEVHRFFARLGAGAVDWRWLVGGVLAFAVFAWHFASMANGNVVLEVRNFYGTGRVLSQYIRVTGGHDYTAHVFEHAGIQHGMQPVTPAFRDRATMCFGAHAGGLSIVRHPKYESGEPMRVAVAGMGIATLATYARTNDVYRFYEINPQVATIASNTNLFWYLSDTKAAECKVVVDDARRALEKERARNEAKWDVIIIDVFAGDSIPPHMSTKEAVQLYLDRLAPGGTLSFHLTNWHLGLSPMVKAVAREFSLHLQGFGCWADKWNIGSYWTFLTREKADFFIEGKHGRVDYTKVKDMPLMTDERHSLLPYISLHPMPEFE